MAQKNPDPRDAGPKPPFPEQTQPAPGFEGRMDPQPDYGEQSYKGFGRLKDRVALVTGGDSGIGRAVCLAFAREGADLAVSFLNESEDAKQVQRITEEAGRQALLLPGDLSVEAHCRKLVEDTVKRFGRIDILVNNAAFQGHSVEKFEEIDPERLERTFRTNILAMFHLVRYALPHMKPGATIINTASVQAYQPSAGILDYASTKGAIVTFTKGLGQHLISRGIRVNAVAPGPVWTPLIPQSFDGEKVAKFGESNPTGRPAQPAELAPSFVFLASDESRFVNAEILGVTGGMVLA
ncbi:MAG TPA: SDR family oxidoreductase [Myxococcus sp.]|nr:SDR family oxidoreductase [Myxococcus sp.]